LDQIDFAKTTCSQFSTGRAVLGFQSTEALLEFRPAWWIVAGIPVVVCTAAEWASASMV
jgi:hypothetical protein